MFKAKTLDSELSQTSTVDEGWTSLTDKLLQATKQVCGVSSNHPWRKQTVVEQPGGGSSKGETQVL